jgi:protein disulfide-isomerase
MNSKMKVEVWSDVMCPFCYIGKRNYEKGLQQFANADDIELVWKSFQLDPGIQNDRDNRMDVFDYLSQRKGISRDQVVQMHDHVTKMAAAAGLDYHLDQTVMVNSFNAHRFLQMAKEKGLGDEAEEQLFYANFTQGKDFSDPGVLKELGLLIGLSEADVEASLTEERYAEAVNKDIEDARGIGVTGVPFFVFNGKYAVSGAQPPESFTQALERSYAEWRLENPLDKREVNQEP